MSKTAAILNSISRPDWGFLEQEEVEVVKVVVDDISTLHPSHHLAATGELYYQDPRPDLEEDSMLWLQAFVEAGKVNSKLVKNLWEMRNWGTRIIQGKNGFVLRPDIDPEGIQAWPDKQTYEKWRNRLLLPYKAQIIELLKNLFEWEGQNG